MVWKTLVVVCVVGGAAAIGGARATAGGMGSDAPAPTVTGPVTGGKDVINLVSPGTDVAPGYVAEEYFLEGTATAYTAAAPLGPDGKWKVEPGDTAPYKTRIVVYRPDNEQDFDGTVFVEWLNVSAGFESAPDWNNAHTGMVRAGAAYVGVSAQSVGVQGGAPTVGGLPGGGLKADDPDRYGTLSHPGDAYSYDIFTQVGRAVAGEAALKPLDELAVKRVIAIGESQSAFRLVTYINAIHPLARTYDGFLVHSRGASGAGLDASRGYGNDDESVPKTVAIRADNATPVLTFQTETDLLALGYLPARQEDSKNFRLWEVAGTAHADAYTGGLAFSDVGDGNAERTLLDPAQATGGPLNCSQPVNSAPAFAVLNAALFHLERWVRDGTPPPRAPRLAASGNELVRDEHGNAKGGIRTPPLDVPLATLSGERNEGGTFCRLFGTTTPFDAKTIAALYPSHDAYVKAFDKATGATVAAGFLLPVEAKHLRAAARAITWPS